MKRFTVLNLSAMSGLIGLGIRFNRVGTAGTRIPHAIYFFAKIAIFKIFYLPHNVSDLYETSRLRQIQHGKSIPQLGFSFNPIFTNVTLTGRLLGNQLEATNKLQLVS